MWQFRKNSDAHIVKQVLTGNKNAFGELIDRYMGPASAIAYASVGRQGDLEDVVQEAFVKAYERLESRREHGKFFPWLAQIVRNTAVQSVRSESRRNEAAAMAVLEQPQPTQDHDEMELQELLKDKLDELDQPVREILLLRYFYTIWLRY